MLYTIFHDWLDVRLFGYITFRTAMAGLSSFAIALVAGRWMISWLERNRIHEDVSKTDAPALAQMAMESGKKGTPTMGGSFLVAALLSSVLLWARLG